MPTTPTPNLQGQKGQKIKYNNYAFIDGQNLIKGVESQNWKLGYKKFRTFLTKNYGITKAFYFIGYFKSNKSLYKKLRIAGFSLKFKRPVIYKDGTIRANVDAELIVNAIIKIPNYDRAIIVAGDSDYYFLSKYLIRQNKLLCVMAPSKNKCSNIFKNKRFRDYLAYVSRNREELEIKKEQALIISYHGLFR